jgi:hypothetical protein
MTDILFLATLLSIVALVFVARTPPRTR